MDLDGFTSEQSGAPQFSEENPKNGTSYDYTCNVPSLKRNENFFMVTVPCD